MKTLLLVLPVTLGVLGCSSLETGQPTFINSRLCFDLGTSRNIVPGHWNQLSEPRETGMVLRHVMDVEGRPTAVNVRQVEVWSGFNTKGVKANGTWPNAATGDSFYVGDGENRSARIRLEGLVPGGTTQ